MRRLPLCLLLSLTLCACREGVSSSSPDKDSLPLSAQCGACHAKELALWEESHHAHAWRRTNEAQEREPFGLDDRPTTTNQLSDKEGRTRMRFYAFAPAQLGLCDHTEGTPAEGRKHKIVAAMGYTPLVQYLVEGERGAFQCTAAAWDVTHREWFDTVADDARLQQEGSTERKPGDWGHWLGRGMTWNSQCASCHVSGFEKNYDAATDSYASTWKEPGVTCIQCHSLADQPTEAGGRPRRRNKGKTVTPRQQADSCATCHARREELRPGFREGDLFEDYYRLELPLVEGTFWPNGAQRDECYTETGMRLSPMGRAGVTCMHCHDSHSGRLRLPAEDNALCLSCHGRAGEAVNGTPVPTINIATHTPCPPGSKGARCVECHMPESTYMARDARRDHAFTSPDPALSAELGHPNACTQCHAGKDNAWAAAEVAKYYGETPRMARYRPRTRAIAAAMRGEGNSADLLAAFRAETNPTWQATLLELLARQEPCADTQAEALRAAQSESPLLRAAAARILGPQAPQLLQDPVRLVRHAAAWAQLDSLLSAPTPPPALAELEETLRHQADHPAGCMQQAQLAQARARHARAAGDAAATARHEAEAEQHFRRTLQLDPASAAARMDFAVYLARHQRPVEALEHMLHCTATHPNNAEAQYRLGLILHELGHSVPAFRALEKATRLAPGHARARRALDALRANRGEQPSPCPPTP